jgi:hypothetical protein
MWRQRDGDVRRWKCRESNYTLDFNVEEPGQDERI